MKSLFLIIPNLEVGGAERLVVDLADRINKKRFQVTIVCLYDKKNKEFSTDELIDVRLVRLGKRGGLDIRLIARLISLFIRERPDIIHTHLSSALYTILPTIIARTRVKIHTVHSTAKAELTTIKRAVMFVLYHVFGYKPVAISDYISDDVASYYRLPINKVKLIYNGVDTHRFSSVAKKRQVSGGRLRVVSIGRLDDNKNHKLLIDAFALMIKNNPKVNIKLDIAGDGRLRKYLNDHIEYLGISEYVNLLGVCSDTPELLGEADIYVNTSLVEGLPLTILEAMSSGLPVVATPAGGTVDIVKDGFNGIITSWNSHDVMTAIMKLVNSEELRKKMGDRSVKLVKDFDVRKMAKEYESIYA